MQSYFLVYRSGAANKLHIFWCPIIEKRWFGGGISYVAFDIKFTSRQVGFFPRQLGFLEFCSRNYFPQKNSLGRTIFLRDSGMFSRGRKIITFWWFSNLLFNWIYFYQFGSSTKITQYTSTRKELANPTVPLIIPKFEFLTKKQRLKVKNHHFLMGFSVCEKQQCIVNMKYKSSSFFISLIYLIQLIYLI